jgi:excisionase family DNA binding protein
MDKLLLRPTEVAEILGIGRSKAYELIGAGTVPSMRIGSSVRVPAEALRAWVSRQASDTANGATRTNDIDKTLERARIDSEPVR